MRAYADGPVRGETGVGGRCTGDGGAFRGGGRRARRDRDRAASRSRGAGRAFARTAAGTFVAVADGRVIGMLHVDVSRHGFGEFGMPVRPRLAGMRAGSALLQATVEWARGQGLHKLCLEVFA